MLDPAVFHRFLLYVLHFDLEGLIHRPGGAIDMKVRLLPLTRNVEGIAGDDATSGILRRVVDGALAGKFNLSALVLPVETNPACRYRYPQVVGFGIFELLHD